MQTTIFTTVGRLALEHQALNLGQGAPDFDPPAWAIASVQQAFTLGRNQYAPMEGVPELRQAISSLMKSTYSIDYDPATEITVTVGATEAIFCALKGLLAPGDEAIVFAPYYDSYKASIDLAGAISRQVVLSPPDFNISLAELQAAISAGAGKTKVIIVNNPHNPSGKVFKSSELELIAELARQHNLTVISDEVYEFLTFASHTHLPFASLPGMKERTITISSMGKTLNATGWKLGYAMAPAALTDKIRSVHQWTTFSINGPLQLGVANILPQVPAYTKELQALFYENYLLLKAACEKAGFLPYASAGTYFFLADTRAVSERSGMDFIQWFVAASKLALIPAYPFYLENEKASAQNFLVRFNFAKKRETILQAVKLLEAFAENSEKAQTPKERRI
jgi:aspartate/methionine/tyrosine aminotransferase